MIKTYFFVPLTITRFIEKARSLKTDYIVYDLEDAISMSSATLALENLKLIDRNKPCYIRPKMDWDNPSFHYLDSLVELGFDRLVLPKAACFDHIERFVEWSQKTITTVTFILLVENPGLLFDLEKILRSFSKHIQGISLGSHDYCNVLRARHEYQSYRFAHDLILNLAAGFSVEAIDITSMEIDNRERFIHEVKQGFNKGYRSKFILHPKQLEYLEDVEYFSDEEIAYARLVSEKVKMDDFDAVKINGQVLEKPHIQRIKEILKYLDYGIEKHR